jgi:hypothetical protein
MGERRQNVRPGDRVELHVLEFLVGEGPCLFRISSRIRSCRCRAAGPRCRIASTCSSGSPTRPPPWRKIRDPRAVAPQVRVLGLERIDQRLERGHRDPLQVGSLDAQLRGPERDLFLEPVVDLGALHLGVATAEGALDGPGRSARSTGLGQVVHRAALHAQRGAGGVVDAVSIRIAALGSSSSSLGTRSTRWRRAGERPAAGRPACGGAPPPWPPPPCWR